MFALAACASCAQPIKPGPMERSAVSGSRFDAIGNVTLHPGQPCASQIMFDFRRGRSAPIVWLAAPMRESTILTNAANHRIRVHIVGKWRRGKASGCNYVEATQVEVQKSAW